MYSRPVPHLLVRHATAILVFALALPACADGVDLLPNKEGALERGNPVDSLSTRSFTNGNTGSDPFTLTKTNSTITVDLSAIAGARVFRATLDPYVDPSQSRARYDIQDDVGNTLPLLAPRYLSFDATAAVQDAVQSGSLTLNIVDSGRGFGTTLSLDVLCDEPAPAVVSPVTDTQARFEDGDTMITFAEVAPPYTGPTWTGDAYLDALEAVGPDRSPKRRYRVYRSPVPFDDASVVAAAELIDEIKPLSGWNGRYFALEVRGNPVWTLPVDDMVLSSPGTGIYVHRYRGSGTETAYYLVSHTIDGAEDFSSIATGQNASGAVVESPGPGMTLLWKQESFNGVWVYTGGIDMTLNYYVRWAAAPDWNLPNHPFNYRIGVPHDTAVPNPPLEVNPHYFGGHFDIWSPWTWYDSGALLLSANLLYYNSYTGFHEAAETLRSYDDGTVQPFHHARVLDFIFGFVKDEYDVDMNRLYMVGASMGGAAGHMWGMRSGHLFAFVDSAVGNQIPAEDLTFEYEGIGEWGPIEWQSLYSNPQLVRFGYPEVRPEDNYVVWDYFDITQWLALNPGLDTPYLTFANSPVDQAIGWPQAWEATQSIIANRSPFNFTWGTGGHGQETEPLGIMHVLNRSVPAFSNGSLDDDLGETWDDSPPAGQINRYLYWDTSTIVDTTNRWEIDIYLADFAPETEAIADVTPRRLQNLRHSPGQRYRWTLSEGTAQLAAGTAKADANGVITVPDLSFSKTPRRLSVIRRGGSGCTTGASPVPEFLFILPLLWWLRRLRSYAL